MNIEEANFRESILETNKKTFLIHIAESNRKYPDVGHLNFKDLIFPLLGIDYEGYISGEMLPYPDSDFVAEQTSNVIDKLLKEYIENK